MKESETNKVLLPEDDPTVFGHFIRWIYESRFRGIGEDAGVKEHLQAWIMADKFCMPVWQNNIMNLLADLCSGRTLEPDIVIWVVDHIHESSRLFSFVLDQFAWELAIYYDSAQYLDDEDMKNLMADSKVSTQILWTAIESARGGVDEPAENIKRYYAPEGVA